MSTGFLKINVTNNTLTPISNVKVIITYPGTTNVLYEGFTDDIGQTPNISLDAPDIEYSQSPSDNLPYSQYTVSISDKDGNETIVNDVQIFPDVYSYLSTNTRDDDKSYEIPANTLFGDYPPKIEEASVKPITETGNIVLDRVVIPEYIVVHDGPPTDSFATNYYVRYKDYIKNVASCEIYSTWPRETLKANILSIMSFTLNRVYTEWYRNKGYNFTITTSTAYDHKWIPKRNIYSNISDIVDEIFNQYISRPNVKQPILTQYCDGKKTVCPGRLSQWGSKYLGDQNLPAEEILKYYYGNDVYINYAEEISGIPSSWPGENLMIGSSGEKVRFLQQELNRIGENYNRIPQLVVDGIYGEKTAGSVREFQNIFDIPAPGITDFSTWYKISEIYVALTRIAEL